MADDAPTLELRIQDNSEKAVQGILSLANSLSVLKTNVSNGLGLEKVVNQLDAFNQKLQATFSNEAVDKINKVADALSKLAAVREVKIPEISVGKIAKDATVSSADIMPEDFGEGIIAQKTAEAADQMRDYGRTVEEVKSDVDNLNENVANVNTKMEDQAKKATKASDAVKEHAMSLKDLAKAGKRVIHPLDDIIKKFNRILFYRVIRSVLREIGKGFSEGIKNVRAYSKAISGSFDKAMTGAENSLFKLKNSLGAALAPALEAIIPAVQRLVSWFITLINYVNQFLALITGKSQWTRAIDASASSFEKTKKSASGAAKEVKNLLAGFDELNIIQSESGGGGGGGSSVIEPDYTNAFEEVYTFDEKIKNIVNWLKDNMEAIKKIAIDLGAAFLAWRVSNAFSGIIGKLGGLIAAGMIIEATWDLVSLFDGKYLDTSEPGWLVSNLVTTALGGLANKAIIGSILSKGAGNVAMGVTLTVSALADVISDVNRVDISALSKESVALLLTAAIKGGAAGVFIAKGLNKLGLGKAFTGGQLVQIAGGASLATFGAGITLKAMVNAVNTEEFGDENLRATIEGAVTLGAGLAWLGKTVGMFETGVVAEEAFGGFALMTLGAYIGLEAVVRAKGVGYDIEFWKKTALSSLLLGGSVTLIDVALGAAFGEAAIVGGLAGVATVGAIVLVSAILQANQEGIRWGNARLTSDQIKAYVKTTYFTVDVPTRVNLINSKIENAEQVQKDLETDALNVFDTLSILKLGVDTQETTSLLLDQVLGTGRDGSSGLIHDINTAINTKQDLLKLSLSIMPVLDEKGNDISNQIAKNDISGWNKVTAKVAEMGNELNNLLIDPETKKLKENLSSYEKNAVEEITTTLGNIAHAISGAQLEIEALSNLNINLSDMTEESAKEVLKQFETYRKELEEKYTKLEYQAAGHILARARALKELGDTDGFEDAMKEYELFLAGIPDRVATAVADASGAGTEIIKNEIIKLIGDDNLHAIGNNTSDLILYYNSSMNKAIDEGLDFKDVFVEAVVGDIKDSIELITGISEKEFKNMGIDILSLIPDGIKQQYLTTVANEFGLDIATALAESIRSKVPEETRKAIEESEAAAAEALKAANEQAQLEALQEAQKLQTKEALDNANSTLDKLRQQEALIDKLQTQIAEKEAILKQPTSWDYITDRYKGAERALYHGSGVFDTSGGLYKQLEDAKAKAEETRKQLIEEVASYNDIVSEGFEEDEVIIFFTPDYTGFEEPPTAPDLSPITNEFDEAGRDIKNEVNEIIRQASRLSSLNFSSFSINSVINAKNGSISDMFRAGGGFVGTGEMFIARESGPELVGRIGNRTAVANNDQIVSGVASGVAAGQSEQNSLLRQQNDLLRQMLAKSGRVEAVPSADWGRFVKRSSEMYAYNTGM